MARRLICILSDQQIPNVLSVLHFRPDVVHLVISDDLPDRDAKRASFLSAVRLGGHESFTVEPLYVGSQKDLMSTRDRVANLIKTFSNDDDTWVLNTNGGTKLMAFGALSAVAAHSRMTAVYMEPHDATRFIDVYYPERVIDIDVRLDLPTFLAACGAELDDDKKTSPALEGTSIELALSGQAHFWDAQNKAPNFPRALAHFNVRAIEFALHTVDSSLDRYLTGDWLEYFMFAWLALHRDDIGITDLRRRVKVKAASGASNRWGELLDTENELDVAFTAQNRLHWVECKTQAKPADEDQVGRERLLLDFYKVSAVTQSLHALGVSVAFAHSNAELDSDTLTARANRFGVALFGKSTIVDAASAINRKNLYGSKALLNSWLTMIR
jgi:hypothetical protein